MSAPARLSPVAISGRGAEFVAAWEGFRAEPYNDSLGNATVGIGHLIHKGPVTAADRERWGTITRGRAITLLKIDAQANAVGPLARNLKVTLTQAQVDALCCLAFNCGPGSLRAGGAVMAAVNSKPKAPKVLAFRAWRRRVEAAFMQWAHPTALTRRRRSEVCLFKTGKYTRATGNPFANA